MEARGEYGSSKREEQTFIYKNFEFWKLKTNSRGETFWRCSKHQIFKCKAIVKTKSDVVIGNEAPEHTHGCNVSNTLARKAISEMKVHMRANKATPSASQSPVVEKLAGHVQMALPKRASLSRVLRRHRQVESTVSNKGAALPAIPTDKNFEIPDRFQQLLLHDSGSGEDRFLVFGDRDLLQALGRSALWLADGTFKVVPTLYLILSVVHNPLRVCRRHNSCRCILPPA
jgi:FLYWCH zinc finger domain